MHSVDAVTPPSLAAGKLPHSPARLRLSCGLAVGLGLLALSLHAEPADLEIGVRSSVKDGTPKWNKEKTEADGGHDMIYGILAIKQVENVDRLVKPVDEKRVVSILMDTLDANGFREFLPGEKPAILITASYGRGEMTNPYIRDNGRAWRGGREPAIAPKPGSRRRRDSQPADASPALPASAPGTDSAPPAQTITGASAIQLFDEKTQGYEAKLQKAAFEKLFIRITAWEYPDPTAAKKPKPKMLWKTVIVVDDPDHRDLNQVAQAMLEAGGKYFDKLHRGPEVEVRASLPSGKVIVGPTEVREPGFELPERK